MLIPESYESLSTRDLRFEALEFADSALRFQLPFQDGSFARIAASLFVSYLFSPETLLMELHRILKPGGTILLSSMRPDSDVSLIFTDYVHSTRRAAGDRAAGVRAAGGSAGVRAAGDSAVQPGEDAREADLRAARSMLNEAASLFELEEEGIFRFYSAEELAVLLESAGFTAVHTRTAMGTPAQAVIAVGKKL